MTKKEYLIALNQALRFLDHESRNAAMAFYQEMLEDRIEEGMTEEEAVRQMEPPSEIAAKISGDLQAASTRPASMPASQAQENGRGADDPELSEDWTPRVFTASPEKVRAVRLQAENLAIDMLPAQDNQITLAYFTRKQDIYTAQLTDGVLTLSYRSNSTPAHRFMQGLFFRAAANPPAPITLRIPPDAALDLSAVTRNGSIRVQDLHALGILQAQSANSSLTAERIACGEGTFCTSNARITLDNVQCQAAFHAKSSNGGIALKNIHTGSKGEFITSNARINAEAVSAKDSLLLHTSNAAVAAREIDAASAVLQTSNGSLRIESIRTQALTLRTSNASIQGVLPGSQQDWQIESGTSNGKNSLPVSSVGNKPLYAHTSNGSINLTFEE